MLHVHDPEPLKQAEKSPSVSEGFEANPEYTESVVNLPLARRHLTCRQPGGKASEGPGH